MLRGFQEGGGLGAQRPQSGNVFRHALLGSSDIGGEVSQQGIRDVFRLSQKLDGATEINGIPSTPTAQGLIPVFTDDPKIDGSADHGSQGGVGRNESVDDGDSPRSPAFTSEG
jgi:hypothetical protein